MAGAPLQRAANLPPAAGLTDWAVRAVELDAWSGRMTWMERHAELWERLVPRSGQADTVQGELIRVTGRLTDEAHRNGNTNWDDGHEL
jgi:hypothetical protein